MPRWLGDLAADTLGLKVEGNYKIPTTVCGAVPARG